MLVRNIFFFFQDLTCERQISYFELHLIFCLQMLSIGKSLNFSCLEKKRQTKEFQNMYSPDFLKNVPQELFSIFCYIEVFKCNITTDWLYQMAKPIRSYVTFKCICYLKIWVFFKGGNGGRTGRTSHQTV